MFPFLDLHYVTSEAKAWVKIPTIFESWKVIQNSVSTLFHFIISTTSGNGGNLPRRVATRAAPSKLTFKGRWESTCDLIKSVHIWAKSKARL